MAVVTEHWKCALISYAVKMVKIVHVMLCYIYCTTI